ncbi:uncharacterized protein [Typha angustifolia]
MIGFHLLQLVMDLTVAGISLMLVLGIFAFIASILCSAAFIHNSKAIS